MSAVARCAAALDALAGPGRVALAVSGGPDSLALLRLAAAARPGGVAAATVDHGLRPAAAAEAAGVAALAATLAVPHAVLAVTVRAAGEGVQAAARAARYAALGAWAAAEGAVALATAHHRDDQAETLLMRLARGAGTAGLAGVRPVRAAAIGPPVVRPLLGFAKAELAAVAAAAGWRAADDPTNRDPAHDRTAIRALLAREPSLLPARLARSAAALAEAEAALAWAADREWAARALAEGAGWRLDLAGLPPELARRLLARALPGARGAAVAALLRRLATEPAATLAGREVRRAGDAWLVRPAPPRRGAATPPPPSGR